MNKFYLIDKPLEITSFDILRILKKKLNFKKMGHTGTLDPLATGLVLVATGNYTKLIPYLEKDKKTYEFELSLDGTTKSFDLAEKINFLDKKLQEKAKKEITKKLLEKILKQNFTGIIEQTPPKYSALKINGQRAYKLARDGKDFKIKKRKVEIFSIKIINFSYPKLSLKAEVSAGTYIRSIAFDIGKILGTGAYISKLRRTKIGNLDLTFAQNLENFDKNNFLKEKIIFKNKNFIQLPEYILKRINNGLETFYNFENKDFEDKKELFVTNKLGQITNIEDKKELFVTNKLGQITNIVEYKDGILKAKRKI